MSKLIRIDDDEYFTIKKIANEYRVTMSTAYKIYKRMKLNLNKKWRPI